MKKFRDVIFWIHLLCGTFAGVFIFVMCVTGALIAFEKNIINFAERDMQYVSPPVAGTQQMATSEILTKLVSRVPDVKPSGITIKDNPNAALVVSTGREGKFYVNPYTGEITGTGAKNWEAFFEFNEDLHRRLAFEGDARAYGKWVNDAANFLFAILAITGIYIWFPRKLRWKSVRPVIWFKTDSRGKARNFNWHNTIGFWTSLVLIILTVTGIVISYKWASDLVYTITGNSAPPRTERRPSNGNDETRAFSIPANLDQLVLDAKNHGQWKAISLTLPVEKVAQFNVEEGIYWNRFARSTLTLNAQSGEVETWKPYSSQNSGQKLRSWIRFTHTGESFGLFGQFIAFLACIGGAFLVWTGFSLALTRFKNWRLRKNMSNA
ncbi:MAG: PepSY-associated TM helix domain-containing protein [Pyrinomonadaceae bacterium]